MGVAHSDAVIDAGDVKVAVRCRHSSARPVHVPRRPRGKVLATRLCPWRDRGLLSRSLEHSTITMLPSEGKMKVVK